MNKSRLVSQFHFFNLRAGLDYTSQMIVSLLCNPKNKNKNKINK